jgi:hypothetical protein
MFLRNFLQIRDWFRNCLTDIQIGRRGKYPDSDWLTDKMSFFHSILLVCTAFILVNTLYQPDLSPKRIDLIFSPILHAEHAGVGKEFSEARRFEKTLQKDTKDTTSSSSFAWNGGCVFLRTTVNLIYVGTSGGDSFINTLTSDIMIGLPNSTYGNILKQYVLVGHPSGTNIFRTNILDTLHRYISQTIACKHTWSHNSLFHNTTRNHRGYWWWYNRMWWRCMSSWWIPFLVIKTICGHCICKLW